ncbi:MAG: endonuclease, partial [Clostridia bacterium]|nr:endonuclease [Clostridia bacterium]
MKNKREKKRPGVIRRVFRAVGIVLAALLVLVGGLVVFLSVTEYRPAERETLTIEGEAARTPAVGDTISILTWNVGYGALGDNADFFMDGGKGVRTADRARLEQNMAGIVAAVTSVSPDVLFVQEVDRDSARSCRVDELAQLRDAMPGYASAYATNFKVAFVPYPVPPLGRVDSGLATFSSFAVSSAERLQLPVPFKWPVRMANLKRGLLVFRVP